MYVSLKRQDAECDAASKLCKRKKLAHALEQTANRTGCYDKKLIYNPYLMMKKHNDKNEHT